MKKDDKRKPMDISSKEFSEYDVPNEIEEKEHKPSKFEKFQLFMSFIGALYFAFNIYLSATKFKDSKFYPYIIGLSIAYIIIFFIFILAHRNSAKDIKKDKKNFKSSVRFVKLILNLLFVASSLLIFIESVQAIDSLGLFATLNVIFSGILIFFKLISAIKKIRKAIEKRKKQIEKEKKNK